MSSAKGMLWISIVCALAGCGSDAASDSDPKGKVDAASGEQPDGGSSKNDATGGENPGNTGSTEGDAEVAPEPGGCDGTPDSGTETRKRYAAAQVAHGAKCESESQTRTCNDGRWSEWSGSFVEETCEAAKKDVLTCDQHSKLGYGVCHEFSGENAANDLMTFCGAGEKGTGCPDGAIGQCDLSSVGTNPPGYVQWHYTSDALPNAQASKKLCEDGGGTWSLP